MEKATLLRPSGNIAKFYAVRCGYRPGIYENWDDCESQTKGFKGAIFKSFKSREDAENYLQGGAPEQGRNPRFYAVRSGRTPGIYRDWELAQQQISNWPNPKHKCFATQIEAEHFLNEVPSQDESGNIASQHLDGREHSSFQTQKVNDIALDIDSNGGAAHLLGLTPDGDFTPFSGATDDGFDSSIVLDHSGHTTKKSGLQLQATKFRAVNPKTGSTIEIYTDGSSLGNGQPGSAAGVGVYFGPDNSKNISEPLYGPRQTNQRAELTAVSRALEAIPRNQKARIVTDSQYAINCLTDWCTNWRQNGWKNSSGKPVENRDLVEIILEKVEQRNRAGAETTYRWIKGHAGNPGNVEANRMAQESAFAVKKLATENRVKDETCSET